MTHHMAARRAPSDPLPTEHGDVVAVHYRRHKDGERRPHSIIVRSQHGGLDEWDALWCERDGVLYVHRSGGGRDLGTTYVFGGAPDDGEPHTWVWTAACVSTLVDASDTDHVVTDAELVAMGIERLADILGDPFEDASEQRCWWCDACEDWIPDEGLCRHLYDTEAGIAGPGRFGLDAEPRAEVLRFLKRYGLVRTVRSYLRRGRFSLGWIDGWADALRSEHPFRDAGWHEDDAYRWLAALDEKTTAARAAAILWLDEEIARQDARRAAGEAGYVLRLYGEGGPTYDRGPGAKPTRRATRARRVSWAAALERLVELTREDAAPYIAIRWSPARPASGGGADG